MVRSAPSPAHASPFDLSVLKRLRRAFSDPVDHDGLDGIDPGMIADVVPILDRICTLWYRMEVQGMDRIPPGKALVVINHQAGISFVELLGFGARWYLERGLDDAFHGLAHDAILDVPWLGNFLIRGGGVRANHANADALFPLGRKLMVAPGGNAEAFRPYRERKRIKLGGHMGFVRLALRHGAPICPVVFDGGHETFMVLWDGASFARLLGPIGRALRVKTWPLFLGLPWGVAFGPLAHIPLPAKVRVRCLDPIPTARYGPEAEHDAAVVEAVYRQVECAMQTALDEMTAHRIPVIG